MLSDFDGKWQFLITNQNSTFIPAIQLLGRASPPYVTFVSVLCAMAVTWANAGGFYKSAAVIIRRWDMSKEDLGFIKLPVFINVPTVWIVALTNDQSFKMKRYGLKIQTCPSQYSNDSLVDVTQIHTNSQNMNGDILWNLMMLWLHYSHCFEFEECELPITRESLNCVKLMKQTTRPDSTAYQSNLKTRLRWVKKYLSITQRSMWDIEKNQSDESDERWLRFHEISTMILRHKPGSTDWSS
jgi:hypothetical protein